MATAKIKENIIPPKQLGEFFKETRTERLLEHLEKKYPKGFILKSKGGQYEYMPRIKTPEKRVKLAPLQPPERIFRPKGWSTRKKQSI